MNDLEGHSRSSELPQFDRPHITSSSDVVDSHKRFWDITTCIVYMTVYDLFEVLQFQQDSWNHKQRALSNSCVNIVVNSYYICRGMGVTKALDSKSYLWSHQHSWHSIDNIWFPISLSLHVYILFHFWDITSYFPKFTEGTCHWIHSLGVIYNICTSTGQYQSAHEIWSDQSHRFEDITRAQILKMGHVTLIMPLLGVVYHSVANIWYSLPIHKIWQF